MKKGARVEIRGASEADYIKLFNNEISEESIESLESVAREIWTQFFTALQREEIDVIYWDNELVTAQNGTDTFLRHTLTRSAKTPQAVQLTALHMKPGECVPLSDRQALTFADLLHDVPFNVDIFVL